MPNIRIKQPGAICPCCFGKPAVNPEHICQVLTPVSKEPPIGAIVIGVLGWLTTLFIIGLFLVGISQL